MATRLGTNGDDDLVGTVHDDEFIMDQGGIDSVHGGKGDDTFSFGSKLTAQDQIDGGKGLDQLVLHGDYADGLTFKASTMTGVEALKLARGHFAYDVTFDDGNVAAGDQFFVHLDATARLDGSAETDGAFFFSINTHQVTLIGGDGDDVFDDFVRFGGAAAVDGGSGDDTLILEDSTPAITLSSANMSGVERLSLNGRDLITLEDSAVQASTGLIIDVMGAGSVIDAGSVHGALDMRLTATDAVTVIGGGGDDVITEGEEFSRHDHFDGGPGDDTLRLGGNDFLTLRADTIQHIEHIVVEVAPAWVMSDGNVAAGAALTIDFQGFMATGARLDAHRETDGHYVFMGSGSDDRFIGGKLGDKLYGGFGNDTLIGGGGADTLTGGEWGDSFVFQKASDSAGGARDLITDLAAEDRIDLSAIDADTATDGDQSFILVPTLDGHAGQAVLSYDAGSDRTLLKLDVDGDGSADATILIVGDATAFTGFSL